MEQSDSIKGLAAALSKAQATIEGAKKDSVNPHFKNKYADLSSVWEACRSALTENGLAIVQSPGPIANGCMEMTTMLLHSTGEWVRGSLTIPLGKVDAQSYGSATTYARRYALAAFVGVAPEDDDGNVATQAKPSPAVSKGAEVPQVPTLSQRADRLVNTLTSVKSADELRKAYDLGAKLCADLDATDPERLVEINALYERRFNELSERAAA